MSDGRHSAPPGPTTIASYTILGELGRGGMGTVYRARDTRLRREVALKVLREDLHLTPERLARFENEARVVAALNHPNIAALYGIEDGSAGIQALVLELVEGTSFAARITERRPGLAEARYRRADRAGARAPFGHSRPTADALPSGRPTGLRSPLSVRTPSIGRTSMATLKSSPGKMPAPGDQRLVW
jgi:hypothetical protein